MANVDRTRVTRIADFTIEHHVALLALILAATGFFFYEATRVQVYSQFMDLLPSRHPYIQTFKRFRDQFGGANEIQMAVMVKKGDIYNPETLKKLKRVTLDLDRSPGVDHYRIFSIADKKVRGVAITEEGILSAPPVMNEIPETPEELQALRQRVHQNPNVFGIYVSDDDKGALVTAGYIDERVDYGKLFEFITALRQRETDSNTEIYVSGYPMLVGWMYHYAAENWKILTVTAVMMIGLLIFYFRRVLGVLIPISSGIFCAIWGLGFAGLTGFNLDPLILVIPLLVSARAVSHSVQMVERFYEEYEVTGNKKEAVHRMMEAMFVAGTVGIATDAAGILTILMMSIPILQKTAIFCTFWVLAIVPCGVFLNPILLTLLPAPRERKRFTWKFMDGYLSWVARVTTGPRSRYVSLAFCGAVFVICVIADTGLTIGDVHPGSPILWPDSDYNVSTGVVNGKFQGSDQFKIYLESPKEEAMKDPSIIREMERFQRYMVEHSSAVPGVALPNLLRSLNRTYHNEDPRWSLIPDSSTLVGNFLFVYVTGSPVPGVLDPFISWEAKSAPLNFYYKDHKGDTVREAVRSAQAFTAEHPLPNASYLLAGGNMGVVAAVNEEIGVYQAWNLLIIFVVTFLFVVVSYRSFRVGFFLLGSLLSATVFSVAYMAQRGIGLEIGSLPVQSIGVGVGVDYGIYVVARIRQEYAVCGDHGEAIRRAIRTTGMAVSFTATTLIAGIIFWYFLSDLRFQAEMSILLSLLMAANMLGATFLVPVLWAVFPPRSAPSEVQLVQGLQEIEVS